MTDLDPRIQALFDESAARTSAANANVSADLKADQARLAAEAQQRDDKLKQQQAEVAKSTQDIGKQAEQPARKPAWERPERGSGEMAFGPEDDDGGYQPPQSQQAAPPPPPPPVAPPPAPARPVRRSAPVDDDDDDLSGATWLR